MSRKKGKPRVDKSQTDLGLVSSTQQQIFVISPSNERLRSLARCAEQEYGGTGFGEPNVVSTSRHIFDYYYEVFTKQELEKQMSFPDPKSRPCTMRVKRVTPNYIVLETKRLPGQDNVGMELYIPTSAYAYNLGKEVKCFVAFPEFEGSVVHLSSGHKVRYNHHTRYYEVRMYESENWCPMPNETKLTQLEWQMLTDLKNER